MRRKIIKRLRNIRKNKLENLFAIILSVIFIMLFCSIFYYLGIDWKILLNEARKEILVAACSIVITALVICFIRRVILLVMNKIEDVIKLNPDYVELIQVYKNSRERFLKIRIDSKTINKFKLRRKSLSFFEGNNCVLPIEILFYKSQDVRFIIIDRNRKYYQAPHNILYHYQENAQAHEYSNIYNSQLIRVDDFQQLENNNGLYLKTSRTTYFDSLATNRAADYIWSNGMSIRNIYTYRNQILPLRDMPLSNHLGVNGIIRTKDGYIVGFYRDKTASIGKSTYSISIGAAVQVSDAVDSRRCFTEHGLEHAINNVIHDELNLSSDNYQFSIKDNIIAFYRDWVEMGKPQLLFYAKCLLKAEELRNIVEKRKRKTEKRILFFSEDDLRTATITADLITINTSKRKKKYYKVFPSTAAGVYMYFNEMRNKDIT